MINNIYVWEINSFFLFVLVWDFFISLDTLLTVALQNCCMRLHAYHIKINRNTSFKQSKKKDSSWLMKIDKIETARKMRGVLLCKSYLHFWTITVGNFSFILFTFVYFLIGKVIRLKFLDLFIHRTVVKYFALNFSVTPSFYSVLFFELIFLYKGRIILYFWRKYALAHTLYGVGLFCVLISELSYSRDIPLTLSRSQGSLLL